MFEFEKYLKIRQEFISRCLGKRRKKLQDFLAKRKPVTSDDGYNHKKMTDELWE